VITSLVLALRFLIGIGKRLGGDAYYRSLGMLVLIMLLIGTLFAWLVGKWPFLESLLYAVTTMSMNTPYSGPHVEAAGREMVFFHMVFTFLSVGIFIIFAMETGKTMIGTYDETMKKMAARKARKAAAKVAGGSQV